MQNICLLKERKKKKLLIEHRVISNFKSIIMRLLAQSNPYFEMSSHVYIVSCLTSGFGVNKQSSQKLRRVFHYVEVGGFVCLFI